MTKRVRRSELDRGLDADANQHQYAAALRAALAVVDGAVWVTKSLSTDDIRTECRICSTVEFSKDGTIDHSRKCPVAAFDALVEKDT